MPHRATSFELWDTDCRHIAGDCVTEDAALAAVRAVMRRNGRGAAASPFLAFEDRQGSTKVIASGAQLADRAEAASSSMVA